MARCSCFLNNTNGIEILSLFQCYLVQSHKIQSILNRKHLTYYVEKRCELFLLMFELGYLCYVREKICLRSLDMANMDPAIGNNELISVQQTVGGKSDMATADSESTIPLKLVPLNSNLVGHDDDGDDSKPLDQFFL